jgi:hypothetical protein
MKNEEQVNQGDSEEFSPDALAAQNFEPNENSNQVDQEMADEYGWTPQQAEESTLYL